MTLADNFNFITSAFDVKSKEDVLKVTGQASRAASSLVQCIFKLSTILHSSKMFAAQRMSPDPASVASRHSMILSYLSASFQI